MKKVNYYLFLLIILAFGCGEENTEEIPNVEEGQYVIKLYNSDGDLLLTKKGDAENFGTFDTYWEIRLLDPSLETFAALVMSGESSSSAPKELKFDTDNTVAAFRQRWYSASDDWGYKNADGTLRIISLDESKIKGSFEINLVVTDNAQQNPSWGERIVAKGYFSSTCPYEHVGGCR